MEPVTRRSERVRSPEAQKHAPFIDGNNFAVPSRGNKGDQQIVTRG